MCQTLFGLFQSVPGLRLVFSKVCLDFAWSLPKCARSLSGLIQSVPGLGLVFSKVCLDSAWSLPKCAGALPGLNQSVPGLSLVFTPVCLDCAWSKIPETRSVSCVVGVIPGLCLDFCRYAPNFVCFARRLFPSGSVISRPGFSLIFPEAVPRFWILFLFLWSFPTAMRLSGRAEFGLNVMVMWSTSIDP